MPLILQRLLPFLAWWPRVNRETLRADAIAGLTGGHANNYRRGVAVEELRGLQTVGHGGLWPGFRTEFLRVPKAGLTVVVIANLGSIDPWRRARTIAALALEGDRRMKPALAPITAAEINADFDFLLL